MATTTEQQVLCPVCHQSDQVMKASKAYERGVTRLAPPVMPVAHVGMMGYIIAGFGLVTIGVFLIFIWSGTIFGNDTSSANIWEIVQVVLTIIAIVVALGLSLYAFLRIVQGDLKSQKYLPAYDEALAKWNNLYYCKRDDVVFDPQTNKTIPDGTLHDMLTIDTNAAPPEAQSATVSH